MDTNRMTYAQRKVSRRELLRLSAAAGAITLAACAAPPTAPSATPAPAVGQPEGRQPTPDTSRVGTLGDELLEIEYWHRMGGDAAKILEQLAAEFSQQHDGKIKLISVAQGSIADLNKKIRAAAAGGGMPAVTMADDYDVTQYAASDILVPLDDYINDPVNGLTEQEISDILPNQLNRHKLDIYGGKTMAFTQGFSAFTTFWNADALKKAGVEAPPKNWDDFPAHIRDVVKANPGMAGWEISGAGDRFISCMKTYGVEWLKPGGQESNFDAPEALEILTWWRQLSDEGLLSVPTQGARDNFIAGKNVYWMDSSGNTAGFSKNVKTFAWDAAMPPQRTPAGSKLITETYGPVNALPKTSPEKQLAGWMWIKWLLQPEIHARYIAVTNYFPSTKSAVASEVLKAYYESNPTARKLVDEVAPHAEILTPHPALTEVRGQITANVVNEVLLKKLTPEEGVKKLKAEADKAIRNAARA
jgi:ABC-type glycerol-3-phosphate transport system substrate-binding protein